MAEGLVGWDGRIRERTLSAAAEAGGALESDDGREGSGPRDGDGMCEMAREDGGGVPAVREGVQPLRPIAGKDLEAPERDAIPHGASVRGAPLRMPGARGEDDVGAVGRAGLALHGAF